MKDINYTLPELRELLKEFSKERFARMLADEIKILEKVLYKTFVKDDPPHVHFLAWIGMKEETEPDFKERIKGQINKKINKKYIHDNVMSVYLKHLKKLQKKNKKEG